LIMQLKSFRTIVFLFVLATPFTASYSFEEPSPPNVIVFVADDLGWADLEAYDNPLPRTPFLNEIAERGTVYEHFYAASPVCSPARAGLATGTSPADLGIYGALHGTINKNSSLGQVAFLPSQTPTIMSFLRTEGYKVFHVGKWHLGSAPEAPDLSEYGIDEHYAYALPGNRHPELRKLFQEGPHYWTEVDDKLTDNALRMVQGAIEESKPFYLNLSFHAPHQPLYPKEQHLKAVEHLGGFVAPAHKAIQKKPVTPAQTYYAAIHQMDQNIGRVIQLLKEKGQYENTIIMFMADNGPGNLGNAAQSGTQYGRIGPFRGVKGSLYEGGIRVPFIISWPAGGIPEDEINTQSVVSATDILPSLANFVGFEAPGSISGEDMSDVFLGDDRDRTRPLFWITTSGQPKMDSSLNVSPVLAMYKSGLKFLVNQDGSRPELYNPKIDSDPAEIKLLNKKFPEHVEKSQEALLTWYKRLDGPPKFRKYAGKVQIVRPD